MIKILPNIDAYGTYARRSALADALELQAMQRPSISRAELADYIRDNGWIASLGEQYENLDDSAEDLGGEVDASDSAALRVFAILEERREILGGRYPFEIRENRLYSRLDGGSRAYLLLLAVTTCHAYSVYLEGIDPRYFFEDIVTACLYQRGLRAGNLGRARRENSSFREAVEEIGKLCGLFPYVSTGVVRKRAQEEGVDVIAHLSWEDSRPFHWVFIVQATCGKSDTWQRKLFEPSELMWKNVLGLQVLPKSVLAVPHHIQSDTARYLTDRGDGQRLLLDRLRLCFMEDNAIRDAERLFDTLGEIEVDFD